MSYYIIQSLLDNLKIMHTLLKHLFIVATTSTTSLATFEMPEPAECFSEWWDTSTKTAFARFEDNTLYEFETMSDVAVVRAMHSWD